MLNRPESSALHMVEHSPMLFAYLSSINILGVIYPAYSLLKFRNFTSSLEHNYSTINRMKTQWIYTFLILTVIDNLFRNIGLLSHNLGISSYGFYMNMRMLGDLCSDIIAVYTVFMTLFNPVSFYELKIAEYNEEKEDSNSQDSDNGENKYGKLNLKPDKIDAIKTKLIKYMNDEKPYLTNSLTLNDLSIDINVPLHHLSLVINSRLNRNFHTFINEYRVEESQRRIAAMIEKGKEDNLLNIALDSGFNSKTAFNTYFKKTTGMTPTEYKNTVRNSF